MKARIPLAALTVFALGLGCTGPVGPAGPSGDAGPQGAAGPPGDAGSAGPVKIASNSAPASDAASAAWAALAPQVTVTSVTISSPPVVHFTVTDANGLPVIGLGNTSQSSTAKFAGLTNLAFALAKLVPGTTQGTADGGTRATSPSYWVSYIVTTVPTTTAAAAPTRPSTDNTGTLVDNGDGTYVYTFYRDVTKIAAFVADAGVTAPNNTADLGDLSYVDTLVHRLTIQLSGNAPGTGTNTPNGVQIVAGVAMVKPVDAIYDFIPATGQIVTNSGREIVATANCDQCHQTLGGIPGDDPASSGAGFHGGNRNDTRYCVVCHTEQRKYGRTEATFTAATLTTPPIFTSSSTYVVDGRALGNFPNHVHHIHMGENLVKQNYNYNFLYNTVKFPQDLRNCTKCHDGSATAKNPTAQGDDWKTVPSRLACGGCHDGIDFATGMGVTLEDAFQGKFITTAFGGFAHSGGPQPDDTQCTQCHNPTRPAADPAVVHLPVTPPNPQNALAPGGTNANTNAAWIASNPSRLPAGAIVVTYDIKSVSVNASKQPVMVFRMLQNGVATNLNNFATTAPNPATGAKEIWDNFMGSPSLYWVFAVPQDGISAPADFNASVSGYLRSLWNGAATGTKKGTLSTPDSNGYYTATLTGVTIPSTAVMLTGGMGYSYNVTSTLPLTQTNLTDYPVSPAQGASGACVTPAGAVSPPCVGGLIVIAPNVQLVATGFIGRRPIVEDARCDSCHQQLGAFTQDAFHAGQRNDGTTCAWCHTPNQTSSGWAGDSTNFVHAIHAAAKRTVPFHWDATSTTDSFADVLYPGVLKMCEQCHLPGTFDFSASASASALPNRLYRTVGTGIFNGVAGTTTTTYSFSGGSCLAGTSAPQTALGVFELSPYVTPLANYGIGFTFNSGLTTSNSCKPDGTVVSIPAGGIVNADPASLVNSPISTACFACHDSTVDMAHIELNGGSIYQPRSTALNSTETCLICHGTGRIADIQAVHAQ
jgi:OmcA/MtrC family decaheme c-type cytochrome